MDLYILLLSLALPLLLLFLFIRPGSRQRKDVLTFEVVRRVTVYMAQKRGEPLADIYQQLSATNLNEREEAEVKRLVKEWLAIMDPEPD